MARRQSGSSRSRRVAVSSSCAIRQREDSARRRRDPGAPSPHRSLVTTQNPRRGDSCLEPERIEEVIRTNYLGWRLCARAFEPGRMRERTLSTSCRCGTGPRTGWSLATAPAQLAARDAQRSARPRGSRANRLARGRGKGGLPQRSACGRVIPAPYHAELARTNRGRGRVGQAGALVPRCTFFAIAQRSHRLSARLVARSGYRAALATGVDDGEARAFGRGADARDELVADRSATRGVPRRGHVRAA